MTHLSGTKANLLLFSAAIIWGLAFVAQRAGMEHVGPFTFNGIRFALGGFSLIPILFLFRNNKNSAQNGSLQKLIIPACIAGVVLFAGASLQQIGIVYTTAGNAGFITSLYVIIVPVLGLFRKHKINSRTWFGAIFAVTGLFFLSVKGNFTISYGDGLVLASALFFAIHVIIIGIISPGTNAISLSIIQFLVCAVLSMTVALFTEEITAKGLSGATLPILYGGIMSVGVAYTLQVIAQKKAHPTHAAIILSLESLFAVIGGWIILNEGLSNRGLTGCLLMLAGVILSQTRKINQK